MDTDNLALMAAGALTQFVTLHDTVSSDPEVPTGSPAGAPVRKIIVSCEVTASKVTEDAETKFVGELT